MKTIKVCCSGNTGDIIYQLYSLKEYCELHNCKVEYLLKLDRPSNFTAINHPVGDVMLNRSMADMLKPLLEHQPFIESVRYLEKTENEKVDFNLDMFRSENKNLSGGNIALWNQVYYPELRGELHKISINAHPIENEYIIINRTIRYNNPLIDYTILEDKGKCMFVGVESEFKIMSALMPSIEHLQVKDFYELAQYIAGCKLFVGNQSMAFAIAEGLKVKRVLEQYYAAPNVIPQGGECYVFQTQKQFDNLINNVIFAL